MLALNSAWTRRDRERERGSKRGVCPRFQLEIRMHGTCEKDVAERRLFYLRSRCGLLCPRETRYLRNCARSSLVISHSPLNMLLSIPDVCAEKSFFCIRDPIWHLHRYAKCTVGSRARERDAKSITFLDSMELRANPPPRTCAVYV